MFKIIIILRNIYTLFNYYGIIKIIKIHNLCCGFYCQFFGIYGGTEYWLGLDGTQ